MNNGIVVDMKSDCKEIFPLPSTVEGVGSRAIA